MTTTVGRDFETFRGDDESAFVAALERSTVDDPPKLCYRCRGPKATHDCTGVECWRCPVPHRRHGMAASSEGATHGAPTRPAWRGAKQARRRR